MLHKLFNGLVMVRETFQEIGLILAIVGGVAVVGAVNVLLWRWAL